MNSVRIILIVFPFFLLGARAQAASFDCRRTSAPDEVTVCVNPKLSSDDEALNMGFIRARQLDHDMAISVGRAFIKKRRACGTDVACIDAAQSVQALPMRVSFAHVKAQSRPG
jgi:uncharacterized protein